jgi:hypothetical protein
MWWEALKIFGIGFPGVILTLGLMALIVYLVGVAVNSLQKKKG